MYQDPLFLIGLMGAIGCIGWWILDNLTGEVSEELEEKLNRIGLIFAVVIVFVDGLYFDIICKIYVR